MSHARGAWVFLGVLAIAAPALPLAALADPPPPASQAAEADAHFREGVSLYKEQSFPAALVEFRKAYAVLPDWHVLYNIGITQLELRDDAGAFTALGKYLHEAAGISDKRKAEVVAQVERLKSRVGALHIAVNREGAEVTIDDVSVGRSPLPNPVVVNIGTRRVVATLADGQKSSRLVDVASRDDVTIDLTFAEVPPLRVEPPGIAAPSVVAPSLAEAPPPPVRHHDYLWVGVVTTGTLAAACAVTGLLALKSKSDAENDASQLGVSEATLQDANGQKHTLAAVSDVLLGSAVLAGGVTLYFAFRHPGAQAASSARSALSVSLAPAGVSLSAGF